MHPLSCFTAEEAEAQRASVTCRSPSYSATGLSSLRTGALDRGDECLPKGSFAVVDFEPKEGGREREALERRVSSPEPRALSPSYLASESRLICHLLPHSHPRDPNLLFAVPAPESTEHKLQRASLAHPK